MAKRKFQIGDLCTTDRPKWMNKEAWETSAYIYEVVGYKDRQYQVCRTPVSLERFNRVAWRKDLGGEIKHFSGVYLSHVPDYIVPEHRQHTLNSVENLEEYEGLFV